MSAAATDRFTLREYAPGDFDALLAIDQVCFPAEVACLKADLKATLKSAEVVCFVAECEERKIAGFVVASVRKDGAGHVITLDVAPGYRRNGIGERLMRAAEQRLDELGMRSFRLEVGSTNSAAQKLYEKLGYAQTGFIQHYYADGSDAWVMEKRQSVVSAAHGR